MGKKSLQLQQLNSKMLGFASLKQKQQEEAEL
jgi:hypothetical protein